MRKIIYFFALIIPTLGMAQNFISSDVAELLNHVETGLKKSDNMGFANISSGVVNTSFLDSVYEHDYGSISRLIVPAKNIRGAVLKSYGMEDDGPQNVSLLVTTIDSKQIHQSVSSDLLKTMIARYKIDSLLPIIFAVKRYNDSMCLDILVFYYDKKQGVLVGPSDMDDLCNP
jgi:hypothetical protein